MKQISTTQEQRETSERIKKVAQRRIWVTFQREGIHCYPAAATDPTLASGDQYDVSFLASPHRHIFHFQVWIDVQHNDREIEFIQFKRWLENLYAGDQATLKLDFKSCEMMADDLYDIISAQYPRRSVWIEVSEDGENGAFVKYDTHRPIQIITI